MAVFPKLTKSKNDLDFEWLLCLASQFEMVKKGLVPRKVDVNGDRWEGTPGSYECLEPGPPKQEAP